jgi:uncharacterized membrane protein
MPYRWIEAPPESDVVELHLWPHQSLPSRGFAAFLLGTFALAMIPVLTMLGSVLLWGLLPFVLLALAGLWYALERNFRDHQILEVLTLDQVNAHLSRKARHGAVQDWTCNRYWMRVDLHKTDGPVPNYVTLSGNGREVEIGAFLSEDERKALYQELLGRIQR